MKDNRERIKFEYKVTGREIQKKCGEVWRELPDDEKQPYQDQTKELNVSSVWEFWEHFINCSNTFV
jgi:hypothetical protein